MGEKEPASGGQIRNLLIYGAVDQPRIIIPERNDYRLLYATNFASVPPLLNAIPRSDGRPYAIFDAHIEVPFPKTKSNVQVVSEGVVSVKQDEMAAKPSVSLLFVSFSDPTNALQNIRQVDRGLQRVAQYGKLVEFIANCEGKLQQGITPRHFFAYQEDGKTKSVILTITPEILRKLKHVAASFYADELAKEPLTKGLAKDVKAKTVLEKEAVVAEAERIIFDSQRKRFSNFEVKRTEISNQTNQPLQSSDKKEGTEKASKREPLTAEASKEDVLDPKEILEAVEQFLRLDRPSKGAARYLEELWNRPF